MPKERFHLFIADEYLRSCKTGARPPGVLPAERLAFFLGAVSPDIFFYDLPAFALGKLGDRLHDLMDRDGLAPIRYWLSRPWIEVNRASRETALAWGLGFASHFLADALWHPIINDLDGSLDICLRKGLSEINCHRFIESEMESFWLGRAGVSNRYSEMLERFASDEDLFGRISLIYGNFLAEVGLAPYPPAGRIRRCFVTQNLLLRLFSNAGLGRYRDRLLDSRLGRYLGALVTPERPILCEASWKACATAVGAASEQAGRKACLTDLFSDEPMKKNITSLTARLSDFAGRLALSPPS